MCWPALCVRHGSCVWRKMRKQKANQGAKAKNRSLEGARNSLASARGFIGGCLSSFEIADLCHSRYQSGEEIRKGDCVLFHGKRAQVELVACASGAADPTIKGYLKEFSAGIMILDPSVS